MKLPQRNLGRGVRILHLSDFHASAMVPFSLIEKAIDLGLAMRPDLICLTGDFVTNADRFDETEYSELLKRLSKTARTFACLGNHDGGLWAGKFGGFRDTCVVRSLLEASDVTLLDNRSELIRIHGQSLRLVGVGDLWSGELNAERAFEGARTEEPTILLAHNPDTKDVLAKHPWDLMLSGHTHSNTFLVTVFFTSSVGLVPFSRPYSAGSRGVHRELPSVPAQVPRLAPGSRTFPSGP